MEQHIRKKIRLQGYDYGKEGSYFITVCTVQKEFMLGEAAGSAFHISSAGRIVEEQIGEIHRRFPNIIVDKYVLMANHIHLLCTIHQRTEGASLFDAVRAMKSISTKLVNQYNNTPGAKLWQDRFNDRIVRNEKEYQAFWKYIDENQLKVEIAYRERHP